MDGTRIWHAVAAAQLTVTVSCAVLTAGYFMSLWRRAATRGRRTAALALGLTALGVAIQALLLAERGDTSVAIALGLPACAGQALSALLVLRQLERD